MNDGEYVSMVHSPFTTTLAAYAQRIEVAIMKCGYTWLSLTITVTTNRVRGVGNGFSSKKDLLPTNPAKKDAGQARTEALHHLSCFVRIAQHIALIAHVSPPQKVGFF